jgi:tRNA-uridine 2-sulfurtransferase
MNRKAIVLLSGGLDSILAAKMMLEQGVEILCMNFYIEFAVYGGKGLEGAAEKAAKMLGVKLETVDITEEYLEMFKNPKHGYGANINPCIDCKIFMLKKAKARMAEAGASFLVTGEVLGERPMSQRRDALSIIEKQADVKGILLRPLTAKLLEPTLPEKEGVVDREKLLDIKGRSRKPQMELSAKFGIKEYPNPAGGCLLTDPGFANRVKDLISHNELGIENLKLLKTGRHFRLAEDAKLVVGRDKEENEELQSLAGPEDVVLKLKDRQGPVSVLRGRYNNEFIKRAASIAAYHTKFRGEDSIEINYWNGREPERKAVMSAAPAKIEDVEKIRI